MIIEKHLPYYRRVFIRFYHFEQSIEQNSEQSIEQSFEGSFEQRVFAVKAFAGCALNKSRSLGMMGLLHCIIIKFIREARTRIMEIMTGNKGKVH